MKSIGHCKKVANDALVLEMLISEKGSEKGTKSPETKKRSRKQRHRSFRPADMREHLSDGEGAGYFNTIWAASGGSSAAGRYELVRQPNPEKRRR